MNISSKRELTPLEKKMVQEQVAIQRKLEKEQNKLRLRKAVGSVQVIKDQIQSRKEKNLPNDWEVRFLEEKLESKTPIISNLKKLVGL